MKALQQYDVGAVISIPVRDQEGAAVTLSGTESAWLLLEAPSGRRKKLSATVDAPAGLVNYTTSPLDLDEWGNWRVQVLVVASSWTLRSATAILSVRSNLDTPNLVLLPDVTEVHAFSPTVFASPFDTLPGPMPALSLDAPMIDEELLSADSDFSGGDWVSGDLDTSWLVLPLGRLIYPKLRNVGMVQWDVTAIFYKTGVGAQVTQWELVDNDVPTGAVLSFSSSAQTAAPGMLVFTAELRVVHDSSGTTLYDLVGREQRRSDVGATISDITASARPAIDSKIDHDLRFRLRKTAINGDAVLIRSHAIRQPIRRRGV